MKNYIFILLCALAVQSIAQTRATITETSKVIKTYPYSDPSPVPIVSENPKIYPYNKIEGYSHQGKDLAWKVIVLENDYIIVWVLPEVGGKIWGAIEKSTGKDFIYQNDVIKFRNIALRGPWTMGGIELNFGIIGHSPSTASKVDYITRENEDGSVSCFIGNMDLPSRTQWRVEVRLPADKAYFETNVMWYNPTPLNQSYYNWMTGTAVAAEDLEFYCPGNLYLEHSGEAKPWPIDAEGRNISVYKNNNFGPSKSYHVVGILENYFGGYYHDNKFGFGHWSLYEEMPGKKIWQWTHSRAGEIWEDLASDTHGQHIEFQAGRLFSQHSGRNHVNPIRQVGFSPYTSDRWEEIWFPIKEIGGMTTSSRYGILNIANKNNNLTIGINALQNIKDTLYIKVDNAITSKDPIVMKPMGVLTKNVSIKAGSDFEVFVGDKKLYYTSKQDSLIIKRPFKVSKEFQLSDRQGLVIDGMEAFNYREYEKAIRIFSEMLDKDPSDKDALLALSELYFRRGEYDRSLHLSSLVLMQNTYNDQANYLAGIVYRKKRDFVNALESLGWAARSIKYRTAAYEQMAEIYVRLKSYDNAVQYAQKALDFNRYNISARETEIIANRLMGNETNDLIRDLQKIDPLNHLVGYERFLSDKSDVKKDDFTNLIANEFPEETYLELAIFYNSLGLTGNAEELLSLSPSCVKNELWLAYLHRFDNPQKSADLLSKSIDTSPEYVFPYRRESLEMLEWGRKQQPSWKLDYYLAMVYVSVGRVDEGVELMTSLNDQPDFWVFYVTRAALLGKTNSEQQKSDLLRANEMAPESWRTWYRLIQFYLSNKDYESALALSKKAIKKFPDSFELEFLHSRVLLKNGDYQQCIKILKDIQLLPSEGAGASRVVYEEAHIQYALELIGKKDYKSSVKVLKEAMEWPENIGVGKPYDPEQRKAEYMLAYCYDKLGNKPLADEQLKNIIDYTRKTIDKSRPDHYLGLIALKISGKDSEAKALLAQINNSPEFDSDVKQWITEQYNNSGHEAETKYRLLVRIANLFDN